MKVQKDIRETNGGGFFAKATLTFDNVLIARVVAQMADHKGRPWKDGSIWLDGDHRARLNSAEITLAGGKESGYKDIDEFNDYLDRLVAIAEDVEAQWGAVVCVIAEQFANHHIAIVDVHGRLRRRFDEMGKEIDALSSEIAQDVQALQDKVDVLRAENRILRQRLAELEQRLAKLESPSEPVIVSANGHNGHRLLRVIRRVAG
ncbi:MAG: hypothetical protein GXP39_08040 [Chloroflexi bacterium]|nr:hypothetical protein [Chloroflexota bacterium]